MATFIQRKHGWLAQVRRKGHKSISRTFNTKAEAERWAFKVESDMGVGVYVDNREAMSTTLSECLDRYEQEIDNPVQKIRKPKIKNERDRRLKYGEEKKLLDHCHSDEMRWFIILAIETAMRRGELAGIRREWIRGRVVYLPDTKNGERRNVPLSKRALVYSFECGRPG